MKVTVKSASTQVSKILPVSASIPLGISIAIFTAAEELIFLKSAVSSLLGARFRPMPKTASIIISKSSVMVSDILISPKRL